MLFLEVLVIGRMMRRNGNGESRVLAALFTSRKRLAFHHRHLVLILMNPVMHNIVNSGFRAEVARFELIHNLFLRSRRPQRSMTCPRLIGYFPARRRC